MTDKIEVQGRWIGCKESLAYLQRMDPRLLIQMGYRLIVIFEPMCLVLIKTVELNSVAFHLGLGQQFRKSDIIKC